MKGQRQNNLDVREGDIVSFYYQDAERNKYAINIEVLYIRKNSFTGVILTTKKVDKIYPGDYVLPRGIMPKPTKVICDQPIKIYKEDVIRIIGRVNKEILREIRLKVAKTLGIIK